MNQSVLARKYAQAFYNQYGSTISLELFWQLKDASSYLRYIPGVLFFLGLVSVEDKAKDKMIEVLLEKLKLPSSFGHLIQLLMEHKRIYLFPLVVQVLVDLCQEKHNALLFTISAPEELESGEKEEIERFLHRLSGCHILAEFVLDKKLIAGIRALNKNYMWEYSIESKMWSITNSLV